MEARQVKEEAGRKGAALCGVAPLERFEGAPGGFHPLDILPGCRSVVVLAIPFPASTLQARTNAPYTLVRNLMVDRLDRLTTGLASWLEARGAVAVPIPSADPYDHWDEDKTEGRGILSLKHAAVRAGLGIMGRNTLLINDRYGNMIWLGAVLTRAELEPDPLAGYQGCLEGCSLCLEACPQRALDGVTINQKLCRERSTSTTPGGGWVLSCNICRKVCPNHLGA